MRKNGRVKGKFESAGRSEPPERGVLAGSARALPLRRRHFGANTSVPDMRGRFTIKHVYFFQHRNESRQIFGECQAEIFFLHFLEYAFLEYALLEYAIRDGVYSLFSWSAPFWSAPSVMA